VPLALLVARLWPGEEIPPLQIDWRSLALGGAGAVPPIAILFLLSSPPQRNLPFLRRIREILRDALGETLAALRPWHMVVLALAAGVGEEALFRGALEPRMGRPLTAVLFGLLHAFTPAYAALAAIFGGYLGWLKSLSGSLLAPILTHALYDAVALWMVRREFRSAPQEEPPGKEEG
jgi:membrane protease YdiL (CAAX protease family)